jgi:hypothetical protein
MAGDLNLQLRIDALVRGAQDVKRLASELQGLTTQAQKKVADPTAEVGRGARAASADVRFLGGAVTGFISQLAAVAGVAATVRESMREITAARTEMRELQVAAGGAGVSVREAFSAAMKLAADDLISVGDATRALSSLLRQGFGLDEAIQLVKRFKDEAVLTAASQEDIGKAVAENAKKVTASREAQEAYAASVGKQVGELSAAEQRQAAFNDKMRESASAAGAAQRGVDELSQAQNRARTSIDQLQRGLGEQLTPALTLFVDIGRGVVEYVLKPMIAGFTALGPLIGAAVDGVSAFMQMPSVGIEETKRRVAGVREAFFDELQAIRDRMFRGITSDQANPGSVPGIARRTDSGGGGTTKPRTDASGARFNLARAEAEAALKIERDALARQGRELEVALEQNLVSYAEYYRRRAALREAEIDAELQARRRELAAAQTAGQSKDEGKRLEALAKVATLQADITVLEARRRDVSREAAGETARAERELAEALARVRDEVAQLTGAQSGDQLRAAFTRDLQPLIDRARAAGQDVGPILQLVDLKTAEAQLRQIEQEFTRRADAISTAEQSINVRRNAGLVTETQARLELEQLYRANAEGLREIAARYVEIAQQSGMPEAIAAAERMKVKVLEVSTVTNEMAVRVRGEAGAALGQFFNDMTRRSKSFGDALVDALSRVRDAILNIVTQRLGQQLVDSLLPRGGGGGGGKGWVSGSDLDGSQGGGFFDWLGSLFKFHSGGVVGGATGTRTFARLSPLAIAAAPRFHSGGEVLSVLQEGEEVLTPDDPRHRRNGGMAGSGVVVNLIEAPGKGGGVAEREDGGVFTIDVLVEQISNRMAMNGQRGADPYTNMLQQRYRLNPAAGSVR